MRLPIMIKFIKFLTIGLAIVGIIFAGFKVAASNQPKTNPVVPLPAPEKPFANSIGASGLVEARRENIRLASPIAGLVMAVHVEPWTKVRAGDPLFEMDSRELDAQFAALRAKVVAQEARLEQARKLAQRMTKLNATSAVSAQDFEDATDAFRIAAAELDASRANITQIESLKSRFIVRAPSDGTILQVNTRVGEFINPTSDEAPMILGFIDEVQVRAEVDEQVAPLIAPGAKAVGFLKGDASKPIPLEFVRIEPFVVPKKSLTGQSSERVDTRVLQVIYKFTKPTDRPIYVGQQMDLFIEELTRFPTEHP